MLFGDAGVPKGSPLCGQPAICSTRSGILQSADREQRDICVARRLSTVTKRKNATASLAAYRLGSTDLMHTFAVGGRCLRCVPSFYARQLVVVQKSFDTHVAAASAPLSEAAAHLGHKVLSCYSQACAVRNRNSVSVQDNLCARLDRRDPGVIDPQVGGPCLWLLPDGVP